MDEQAARLKRSEPVEVDSTGDERRRQGDPVYLFEYGLARPAQEIVLTVFGHGQDSAFSRRLGKLRRERQEDRMMWRAGSPLLPPPEPTVAVTR